MSPPRRRVAPERLAAPFGPPALAAQQQESGDALEVIVFRVSSARSEASVGADIS